MLKKIITSFLFIALLTGVSGCRNGENKGEETAAEVEAALIEGRKAARKFVNRPWKDTTDLQNQLLEARTGSSRYVSTGKPRSAAAYDSAFVSTLKTVRPELAVELSNAEKANR